ncbi:hypothetical protein C370_01534 [Cryptococcus neoformans A1-35-8]|nr:hypothetical protein C369_01528 [Cryptococcus neoformans var. grubii A5-35-17]OXH17629.1 hypothetical protein C370_01534 [Cryptococcus neoformans var. grubii A1-35-8]
MANTRPYTREELKSLRRADLQTLYKLHNLKGANGTNATLIDTLVEYFTSPAYREAFPQPTGSQSSQAAIKTTTALRAERLYKPLPAKSVISGQTAGVKRKAPDIGTRTGTRIGSGTAERTRTASTEHIRPAGRRRRDEREVEATLSIQEEVAVDERQELSPLPCRPPIPTPQSSLTPQPQQQIPQTPTISIAEVQAIISENDTKWHTRLENVEKLLGDELERLRKEVREVRLKCEELEQAERIRTPRPFPQLPGPSSGPRIPGAAGISQSHHRSVSLPFSSLGKRRLPSEHRSESGDAEVKRVRHNGRGEPSTSASVTGRVSAEASSQPHAPSPRKASSFFPPDFFAPPAAAGPSSTSASRHVSVLPRTPSPSRQGIIPDNSQTPRLPSEWRAPELGSRTGTPLRTPFVIERTPEFATTPEPPIMSMSPSLEGEALGSRLTPGRTLLNLHGSTPDRSDEDIQVERPTLASTSGQAPGRTGEGISLSAVTELERIDEGEELAPSPPAQRMSSAGQLRFPVVKPHPGLGVGVTGSPSSGSPKLVRRSISQPNQSTTPSLLGQHSLLAPPALISRGSRAGSERPAVLSRAFTQSPPPRPRSASAMYRSSYGRSVSASSSRHASPLPSTIIPTEAAPQVRSASADYMRIAMFGLESASLDSIDYADNPLQTDTLPDVTGDPAAEDREAGPSTGTGMSAGVTAERRRWREVDEVVTPGHRTLLGTERYNDTRFGDIPVGMWAQPKIDFGTPGGPF